MPDPYRPADLAALAEQIAKGSPPSCPECGQVLEVTGVPPRDDVAYVRHRIWLTCGGCGRTGVVDRPRSKDRDIK